MEVVFTGRAYKGLTLVKRSDLEALCQRIGWRVSDRVSYRTDFLIASEEDTQKAREARRIGVNVQDYAWFFNYVDSYDTSWRGEWRGVREFYQAFMLEFSPSQRDHLNLADQLGWSIKCREIGGTKRYRLNDYTGRYACDPNAEWDNDEGTSSWNQMGRYLSQRIADIRDEERRQREEAERAAEINRIALEKAQALARRPAARWGSQAVRRLAFDDDI